MPSIRPTRVRASFMSAFRQAHAARDATRRPGEPGLAGGRTIPGRRSAGRAAVTGAELARSVATDVEILLNTVHLGASLNLSEHAHVARSVINFGMPDMVHRSLEDAGVNDIGAEIRSALIAHEPRILPASVRVARDRTADATALKLRFVVSACLDCEPLNLPVEVVADLERDTGKITIGRR